MTTKKETVTYTLIKAYPGHATLGKTTTKDMSAFPEFWKAVPTGFKVGSYFASGTSIYLILREDKTSLWLRELQGRFSEFSYNNTLKGLNENSSFTHPDKAAIAKGEADYRIWQKPPSIGGYDAKLEGGRIAFGCNKFNRTQLEAYQYLLSRDGGGERFISIGGNKIYTEHIDKLLKMFK